MASTNNRGPSLEDPHNDIHVNTGRFMQNPVYSAFDPLFWLHHANVDRFFALWQAINHNTTYQTQPADITSGTFTQAKNTWMTADSPLTPFYQGDGQDMHTGRSIASIKTFGYTYPEINDWSMSPEHTRQLVIRQVNQMYGPYKIEIKPGRSTAIPYRHLQRQRRERDALNTERQYYVQIGVDRSELDLPCTIKVMLGPDILAGTVNIMAMPAIGRTNSEIQLNRAIKQLTQCVEDKTVVPLLESKFRLEIRKFDGAVIPLETVPSLAADVQSVDVQIPETDDELPDYGAFITSYPKIGRPSHGYASFGKGENTSSRLSYFRKTWNEILELIRW
ncbi:hypothetical protein TruAng_008507 [Truncatella angustata]|nr:hypothetical protein TruAng_008507 [Truncatella angustata]